MVTDSIATNWHHHTSAPKDLANALARPCYVTWWLAFVLCTNPWNGFIQLHWHLNEFAMFDVLSYHQMAFHRVFNLGLDMPQLLKDSLNHLFEHQATDCAGDQRSSRDGLLDTWTLGSCKWFKHLQILIHSVCLKPCNGLLHLTLHAWVWEWHARAR